MVQFDNDFVHHLCMFSGGFKVKFRISFVLFWRVLKCDRDLLLQKKSKKKRKRYPSAFGFIQTLLSQQKISFHSKKRNKCNA